MPSRRSRSERGQTIFASGHLAYEALPPDLKAKVETLAGLACAARHRPQPQAMSKAGKTPPAVLPHQRSQQQPVVRIHPVTGRKALYLCESGQMDWFDGPFVGMEPGPYGEGAKLLDRLMTHYTRPEFIYVHEWTQGDVLVWDNRCLVHTATWYDADEGAAHDVAHHGARQSRRALCRREAELDHGQGARRGRLTQNGRLVARPPVPSSP